MAKAIQKATVKEFEAIKGRTPWSAVIVREVDGVTWLTTKPS